MPNVTAEESPLSVVLHGSGLDFNLSKSMPSTEGSNMQSQICADFCSKDNCISSPNGGEVSLPLKECYVDFAF